MTEEEEEDDKPKQKEEDEKTDSKSKEAAKVDEIANLLTNVVTNLKQTE